MSLPPPDPPSDGTAALGELRQCLEDLRVNYRGGRTSLRAIAQRTPGRISYTTVGDVLRCDKPPQWETLKEVVIALDGAVRTFHALHAAVIRSGRPEAAPPTIGAHLRIPTRAWLPLLELDGVSEGLLRGRPAAQVTPGLAALDEYLTRSLPGIRVEVEADFRSRTFRVDSVRQFWIVMLVDSVLHAESPGLRRWLLSHTDLILHKERPFEPHLSEVWQWMFDTYLTSAVDSGLFETIASEAVTEAVTANDHNRLYRTIAFLLGIAADDPPSIRLILEALEKHDRHLRNVGGSPAMLGKVRVLIAEADHALGGHAPGTLRFQDEVVRFPADPGRRPGRLLPAGRAYEFRAMKYPLTVGDVDAILHRPPSPDRAKPFVLTQDRTDGTAFGGLWRELTQVVNSVPRYVDGEIWRWDIPTVAEWLVLSGCLDQPYPWGHEPPTPERANLKFDVTSRLSPVGTFLSGRTTTDVYDCCGGVHEIVRELPHDRFVSDLRFEGAFRLAGGSYWSPPQGVTCQRFRHLTARDRGGRPSTVGIRLVVYRESDEERRWAAQRTLRPRRRR
ncbi:hypothetical protein [Plantactinospora sp. GCM10030261]|uniref:hypothetical protein n=1 Tax=Plantactinospora sp. GCM10030261 TaxID=3273420 RepID=UPI003619D624